MGMTGQGPDGSAITPQMGSYGIGVSRLMGAIIEANHDANGIIWPESVAPYQLALINLRADDATCAAAADAIYAKLTAAGKDTQLGKASCRARVCSDVKRPVVRDHLK